VCVYTRGIPVWWRRAVLPSLPWVVFFFFSRRQTQVQQTPYLSWYVGVQALLRAAVRQNGPAARSIFLRSMLQACMNKGGHGISLSGPQTSRTPAAPRARPTPAEKSFFNGTSSDKSAPPRKPPPRTGHRVPAHDAVFTRAPPYVCYLLPVTAPNGNKDSRLQTVPTTCAWSVSSAHPAADRLKTDYSGPWHCSCHSLLASPKMPRGGVHSPTSIVQTLRRTKVR